MDEHTDTHSVEGEFFSQGEPLQSLNHYFVKDNALIFIVSRLGFWFDDGTQNLSGKVTVKQETTFPQAIE